jgi:hypothetical protein
VAKWLLVVAGLIQLADATLHLAYGSPALAACAFVLAVVPFGSLQVARGIKEDARSVDVGA